MLDAGNLLFKVPKVLKRMESEATLKADLILKAFGTIGCDALNIGRYDLAMGEEFLLEKQKTVNFPFISANLIDKRTGRLIFQPYVIKEVGKLRIGILGLMTNKVKLDQSAPDLRVDEPIETAKRIVAELKNKCQVIILLSQLRYQDNVKLADQVADINFIIGRGKAGPLRQKGTGPTRANYNSILHGLNRGRQLGRLDVTVVDNWYHFMNYSERLKILTDIEGIGGRIKRFSQGLNPSSSDFKKINKALKNLDKVGQHLEGVQGGSNFTITNVPMDTTVRGNQQIEMMVKQHKNDIAKIRKQRITETIRTDHSGGADDEMDEDEEDVDE